MVVHDVLDLTSPTVTVGKHSAWVRPEPGSLWGIKVPFQWNRHVQKYRHPDEASYPLDTIAEEKALLTHLHTLCAAPAIGQWVYFKTVISGHLGHVWADPAGAYGYQMQDVTTLTEPGMFNLEELRGSGLVTGSEGAWNDLVHPDRGNVVNGYVIDVRRSWFDRLAWHGPVEDPLPPYVESAWDLAEDLHRDGQFPFRERKQAYQEFYLNGEWHTAEREIVQRAAIMQFKPAPGETVLDLGCCTGGFLQYATLAGAGKCVGVDYQPEFVELARRVARAEHMNICYLHGNLNAQGQDLATMLATLQSIFPEGLDHLLMLSMGKHVGEERVWWWVDRLKAKHTYLETNAIKPDTPLAGLPYALPLYMRGGRWVGNSHDRNERAVYKLSH
jgi:SAM-dependent methyltransferase